MHVDRGFSSVARGWSGAEVLSSMGHSHPVSCAVCGVGVPRLMVVELEEARPAASTPCRFENSEHSSSSLSKMVIVSGGSFISQYLSSSSAIHQRYFVDFQCI